MADFLIVHTWINKQYIVKLVEIYFGIYVVILRHVMAVKMFDVCICISVLNFLMVNFIFKNLDV